VKDKKLVEKTKKNQIFRPTNNSLELTGLIVKNIFVKLELSVLTLVASLCPNLHDLMSLTFDLFTEIKPLLHGTYAQH